MTATGTAAAGTAAVPRLTIALAHQHDRDQRGPQEHERQHGEPGPRRGVLGRVDALPERRDQQPQREHQLGQAAHRGSTAVRSATSAVAATSTAAPIAAGYRKTSPKR